MKGGMQGMMRQIQKMQEEMQKTQQALESKIVTEESGGGMVKVTANGNEKVINIEIDPEVVKAEEKDILEDLIIAAVNKALESAKKLGQDEMAKVTKGMIPPGLNIPGF